MNEHVQNKQDQDQDQVAAKKHGFVCHDDTICRCVFVASMSG